MPVLGAAVCFADPHSYGAGSWWQSSIKSTEPGTQIHPVFSHRKAMVQQEDGRGYVATAEVDSGLKTSFHHFPCSSQSCPSLCRVVARVSSSSAQTLAQILSHSLTSP